MLTLIIVLQTPKLATTQRVPDRLVFVDVQFTSRETVACETSATVLVRLRVFNKEHNFN